MRAKVLDQRAADLLFRRDAQPLFYIYAFSRRFYPKRLTIAFTLYIFCQYMCSLGIEPTTFCAANAMLYHWATEEHSDDF